MDAYPHAAHRCTKYKKPMPDFASITITHTFDDEGASSNTTSDVAPQTWELEYSFTDTDTELAALDTHYKTAQLVEEFQFTEKDGTIVPNVQYKSFESDHDQHKSWIQYRRVVLIRRPA